MEPGQEHLFSFCPFSWLLQDGCPGCGIGHAIAYIFRGEWQASWEAHPLAVPALLVLGHRVVMLLRLYFTITTNHTYIKPTHG
nr:DUF2752 domain-containing protein [Pontibacter vulgaris]